LRSPANASNPAVPCSRAASSKPTSGPRARHRDPTARPRTARLSQLKTGDPTDPATDFGPLSSEKAAQTFVEQIDDAVSKGATLRTGGKRVEGPGAFVEATVLTDVTPQMRAFSEEIFGPGVVIYRVADADEAIELANSPGRAAGAVQVVSGCTRQNGCPAGSA
jgi:acyl-CoA reductase-like NAD-dependent aldehyde dehydrogenase